MYLTLYAKLALTLVGLSAVLSLALALVLKSSHHTFHLELHQRLFRSLAAQLLSEAQDTSRSAPDLDRVLAHVRQLAIASPGMAAYVVGSDGTILASSIPEAALRRRTVDRQPLLRFIEGATRFPLTGDNPLSDAGRAIFSAAPVTSGTPERMLYVILGGQPESEQTAQSAAFASYSMREAMLLGLGNILGALLAALAIVRLITTPVARLRQAMEAFNESGFGTPRRALYRHRMVRDEIDRLGEIFDTMASRITAQFEALRRADHTRRELFANISHDLRTPLTALHGYADTLLSRESLSEADRRRYLEIIKRQAAGLGRLVEGFMELAKLDAPEARLDSRDFALDQLIADVLAELRPLSERKQLALQEDCGPLRAAGDPDLLRRALINLVDNAIRQSPERGVVKVRAALAADGSIEIAVLDQGPGIQADELDSIFLRFRQGGTGAGTWGSAGLGLAIVRRIAELHKAHVSAENRPEGGAIFRFTLPPP